MPKYEKGAIVEGNIIAGQGVIFGTNCVVKGQINIGEGTIIGSLALIEGVDIEIGSYCKIMPFAAIGSNTHIGKNVFIGPYFIMANACNPSIKPGYVPPLERLTIGDDVVIGTGTLIRPGVKIGNKVKINMGSNVFKDVPDGTHIRGLWPENCGCN